MIKFVLTVFGGWGLGVGLAHIARNDHKIAAPLLVIASCLVLWFTYPRR